MVKRSATVMFLFVGLFGIWMGGCEKLTQEQKVESLIKQLGHQQVKVRGAKGGEGHRIPFSTRLGNVARYFPISSNYPMRYALRQQYFFTIGAILYLS